jgi:ABC-type polysaccharide/polyol phosphate export permease
VSTNASSGGASFAERWFGDFIAALREYEFWTYLAWQDIRIRYRRSKIGPLWITISMAIFCAALGLVYGRLFNADMGEYLPFLTVGFVVWGLISTATNEFPNVFVQNAPYLRDIRTNPFTILMRVMTRDLIVFAHNAVIVVGIYVIFGVWPGWTGLVALPGLVLVVLNLFALSVILGIVGARYRDLAPIVTSAVQITFFLSPIMWLPRLVGADSWILKANPVAYFMDLVRSPLLGTMPQPMSWAAALGCLAFLCVIAAWLYRAKGARIVFWV